MWRIYDDGLFMLPWWNNILAAERIYSKAVTCYKRDTKHLTWTLDLFELMIKK